MRLEAIAPTLCLGIAWILALLALIAGRNGQMLELHAIGANVSKIGIDLLADSSLFDLDPSNVMYTMWQSATGNTTLQDPNTSKLSKREAVSSNTVSRSLMPAWEALSSTLDIDKDSELYDAGRYVITRLGHDLSEDATAITSKFQDTIRKSIIKSLSSHPSLSKRDVSAADKARILLNSGTRNTSSAIYHPLNSTVPSLAAHQPTQQSFADALADSIAAVITNSNGSAATSNNPLTKLIRNNKPILATTLRATVNTYLNQAIGSIRTGFAVPDWVSIYQTRWCWGTYGPRSAKGLSGCSDSGALEDLNLAPGLRHTLALMDVQRETPDRVDLPKGVQKTLEGMEWFFHGVYALDVALVVFTGVVMVLSTGNIFMPENCWAWSDFLVVLMNFASALLILFIGAPYAIFEYFNGLVMPGVLGLLNVGYSDGWRFVALHAGAEILTLFALGWWVVLERRGWRDRLLNETEPIIIGRRETQMGMGMGITPMPIQEGDIMFKF